MKDHTTATGGLGGSAARGALVTMGGQLVRFAIQVGGIFVLARILSPEDYGYVVMVTAIVGVGEIFRDFGLSSASIQSEKLTAEQRDNLFWINSGIGLALGAVVFASSWPIAGLYGQPELQGITQVLAATFLLNGLSTQHKAMLNRELRFKALAALEILAPAVALLVAIVVALAGGSYWALVSQQLALPLFTLILVAMLGKWSPGRYRRGAAMGSFIRYGANLLGVQLLTYASRNINAVIIGARFGAGEVGLYDRAFQLVVLPLNQINAPSTRVALPILSKLQHRPEEFNRFLIQGQTVMVYIVTGSFMYAIAQAGNVVAVALGDQWLEATFVFQILAVGGIAQALGYATYWAFLARGLTGSNLRFSLATRPVMIASCFIGSFWGLEGVAAAYSISLVLFWPIGLLWIKRAGDAPARAMLWNGLKPVGGFGIAAVASYWSTAFLHGHPLFLMAVGLAAFTAAIPLIALAWPGFRRDLMSMLHLRRFISRGR